MTQCDPGYTPGATAGGDRRRDAVGASAPIDALGFVDLVARVLGGCQARRLAHGAVDIHHPAAGSADEMVVVVVDSVFVPSRRSGRLDAPDDALVSEGPKRVVHRLKRDDA